MDDSAAMREAIGLGEAARLGAGGDPWVGCVVVAGAGDDAGDDAGAGEILGAGAHDEYGGPHAETVALAQAGPGARGATAYVTLEPCNHHARTPPCTEALVEAGIARVVVGIEDPDPRVAGAGVARLRQAGVAVDVGVEAAAVEASLAPYLHHRRTGRAWCVVKTAVTIDGHTAASDGTSRWITGPDARADAHGLRALSQAVVVGAGTALADRPRLTARGVPRRSTHQPLRVVLDARGRVPAVGPLFETAEAPTAVFTTSAAPSDAVAAWKEAGATVEELSPAPGGGVDPAEVLAALGRRGVVQALVEGGAAVQGAFVGAGLADELVVYLGSKVLGERGRPALVGFDVATVSEAPEWRLLEMERFGDDVRLRYRAVEGVG